jgi:plastocyanin
MSTTLERHQPVDTRIPAGGPDRFTAGAALAVALVLVTVQVLARELIPPLAVFAVVYLAVAAALAVRGPRWLLVVTGLLVVVHLIGSVPFFRANLAHPESPASFMTEVLVLLSVTATLIGAVTGLRRSWLGARRPTVVAAVVVAVLASAVSVVASLGVEGDEPAAGDVAVVAERAAFPERVEVPAGPAVLWIDNRDAFHHTIAIEDTDVREALPASTATRVPIDLAAGTYTFLCDVPGHETMRGVIVVE